jgi:hypothetical protein
MKKVEKEKKKVSKEDKKVKLDEKVDEAIEDKVDELVDEIVEELVVSNENVEKGLEIIDKQVEENFLVENKFNKSINT